MVSTTFFLNENYLTNLNAEKTDKKNPKKKSLWKFTKETFLKVKKIFFDKKNPFFFQSVVQESYFWKWEKKLWEKGERLSVLSMPFFSWKHFFPQCSSKKTSFCGSSFNLYLNQKDNERRHKVGMRKMHFTSRNKTHEKSKTRKEKNS